MHIIKKIFLFAAKTVLAIILIALLAVIATSISPIYEFKAPEPFSGPDVFNPYRHLDTAHCWKRANFHTHTKVEGLLNECAQWPDEVHDALSRFGYDIITFSNHNALTEHPFDSTLQVDVYEHGYNLFKYHKLVFGSEKVNRFDHLVPIFPSQKQFQIDLLSRDSDFITMNHPLRVRGTTKDLMEKIGGYELIELDSGISTENEYWDSALSAGRYCFGLANDDLHYPDRSDRIAIRCNLLSTPSAHYEDILKTLNEGGFYSMRLPDYGNGDWSVKREKSRAIPQIEEISLTKSKIFIRFSEPATMVKVVGQGHTTLASSLDCDTIAYEMRASDPYARIIAHFPEGEVIYTNPFARYDAASQESPFDMRLPEVNILLTILFNLLLLVVCLADGYAFYRFIIKR